MSLLNKSNEIICRKEEIAELSRVLDSKQAEFIAVYGQRRIGKTYLISHFFKNQKFYFELTGVKDQTTRQQLKNFKKEYLARFEKLPKNFEITDWSDALSALQYQIDNKKNNKEKFVIFFDELPWFASRKSKFVPALEFFWNQYLSKRNDIILIVCGSAANWMISKIVNNKAGLHNRLSLCLPLSPFSLKEKKLPRKPRNSFKYI